MLEMLAILPGTHGLAYLQALNRIGIGKIKIQIILRCERLTAAPLLEMLCTNLYIHIYYAKIESLQ